MPTVEVYFLDAESKLHGLQNLCGAFRLCNALTELLSETSDSNESPRHRHFYEARQYHVRGLRIVFCSRRRSTPDSRNQGGNRPSPRRRTHRASDVGPSEGGAAFDTAADGLSL